MPNTLHTTSLRFLGAAGTVTPSSSLLTHHFGKKVANFMIDAGMTPGDKNRISMPMGVDVLCLSHGHVDHVGELPQFTIQNPDAMIFVPKGSKSIIAHNVAESHRLSAEENPEEKMGRWLNTARGLLSDIQNNIPKKGIRRGKGGNRKTVTSSRQEIRESLHEQEGKLESALEQLSSFLDVPMQAIDHLGDHQLEGFFRSQISDKYASKLKTIRQQGIITPSDVVRSIHAIKELTCGKYHRITSMGGGDVSVRFDHNGHLVSGSSSVGIKLPLSGGKTRNTLFSGDIGNRKLGYEGTNPDFSMLYNGFDTVVLESTYGDKIHPDRTEEMRKLDAKIMYAITNRIDTVVITLALERSIFMLYEILQCLDNHKVNPNTVDISYYGSSIGKLFEFFPKGEIKESVKPFLHPLIDPGLTKPQREKRLAKLGCPGPKIRIIISSGGFFPEEGPSAGLLSHMYGQDNLLLISPNFHGEPGSNGERLFSGKDYRIGAETYGPKPGHETFSAKGFSGHGDSEDLVRFARKTLRGEKGRGRGRVFLNHGSDASREALAGKLHQDPVIKSKGAKVCIPKIHRPYKTVQ